MRPTRFHERSYARVPGSVITARTDIRYRLEDAVTGVIVKDTLELREAVYLTTHSLPGRNELLRAHQRHQRKLHPPPRPKPDKLVALRAKEKNWIRKTKLANTKLRKIRAAIRREQKKRTQNETTKS